MNKNLNKAYNEAHHIKIDDNSKIIIMSDCHRGLGDASDNFLKNKNIFIGALQHYYDKGFTYIEVGDGDEMWELKNPNEIVREHLDIFLLFKKFYHHNRFYMIYGNHDIGKRNCYMYNHCFYDNYNNGYEKIELLKDMKAYEAIVLDLKNDNQIFIVHGHQDDFFNDKIWPISKFLVRYLWKPVETIGINDPTSAAKNYSIKNKTEKRLSAWANKEKKILIAGHTHRPIFSKAGSGYYFNDGSCIHSSGITGIEIENSLISLVKWKYGIKLDGSLYVLKEVLAGPEKINNYFNNK